MKVASNNAGARPRFGALSSAVAVALAGLSSASYAQDQQGQQPLEEITVTGSRIVRQDFTANSPIQTVDQQMFEETSAIGVETILNRLPQFVPAVTQFTTGDVQQTATNTVGASTVSLRGLGPNRNLVLINGRRAMPVDPRMVPDTNSIPASAIQRVEVISGGASAVYGADAVGGVVNFILKDDYEGASIDVRFGDTQHGGDQTVDISGLFGVNMADDRGNVMLGIERNTRTKAYAWQRDWRVRDYANPYTNGGLFAFGSAAWFHNEPGTPPNNTSQEIVDQIFNELPAGSISPLLGSGGGGTQFRVNSDDGTVYTGLQGNNAVALGSYRFTGPVFNGNEFCNASTGNERPELANVTCRSRHASGDLDGAYQGLPIFVRQPNGNIKENNLYSWTSTPLERLSAFADGHFDISDNLRVTGQAMVSRTKTESQLGLAAANINQWGALVPFGTTIYNGNSNPYFDIPASWIDVNGNGVWDPGDQTHPDYTINGRYGVECDAPPTFEMPWLDGLPGCTESEAFPTSREVWLLMSNRDRPEEDVWVSYEPDWLRNTIGAGRSTTNVTTTMSFTLGLEGDLPSGKHSWDVSLYTGRSDNVVNQLGSMSLVAYRNILSSPNWGRNFTFDQNPWEFGGFAESTPSCSTGLPIMKRFTPAPGCVSMVSPSLKNQREMTQTILEGNLVGDLAEMRAGTLQYALGVSYRENTFNFVPDNLSDVENIVSSIAGLFPNEASNGKFDVTEIYGELLIPIVSDGPKGVQHFNLELGGRISDWSMEQMPNLETYKVLMDWAISPRYRIRGGFNRAFRAPNLGELFLKRTQIFAGGGASRDWCSQNLDVPGGFSATPIDYDRDDPNDPNDSFYEGTQTPQTQQTLALCRALMGSGAFEYYENRLLNEQPNAGGLGVPNSFGNPNLREEQADTWTIGVAMDLLDDWQLTVDWYQIEIGNMIALESADSTYQRCLDIAFNPTGDINAPACRNIQRNPSTGAPGFVNRAFTNEGYAKFSGVDVQLNWQKQLANGGLYLNLVANAPLEEITRDRADLPEIDHKGYDSCALQMQCQNFDYRVFTTIGYNRGNWGFNVRHQYWPELKANDCRTAPTSNNCINHGGPTPGGPSYNLFSAAANFRFDRYSVNFGIENLLDEDPPCMGANPQNVGFPLECTHSGNGAVYDPLGRRYYVSLTMDF
jgi:iron complex outermembrane receptor protein